uniref:Uncharacterized protein n=1 Tax=Anguilla anguilla TaxID=7936 RepID=A0A0E9SCQ8_ANGAN
MFSVPFDYSLYENYFALGLFETARACDSSLYDLMYNGEGTLQTAKATGTEISFRSETSPREEPCVP